jgi:predicted nucleic acid-binding protein
LVDTSVWIDYFNGTASAAADRLDSALESELVAIGDLILLEILQGFRADKDYEKAQTTLGVLLQFTMLGRDMALKGAENYRFLRKRGITIRKTADVIIATFCIEQAIPLLFSDRDFQPFVDKLELVSAL